MRALFLYCLLFIRTVVERLKFFPVVSFLVIMLSFFVANSAVSDACAQEEIWLTTEYATKDRCNSFKDFYREQVSLGTSCQNPLCDLDSSKRCIVKNSLASIDNGSCKITSDNRSTYAYIDWNEARNVISMEGRGTDQRFRNANLVTSEILKPVNNDTYFVGDSIHYLTHRETTNRSSIVEVGWYYDESYDIDKGSSNFAHNIVPKGTHEILLVVRADGDAKDSDGVKVIEGANCCEGQKDRVTVHIYEFPTIKIESEENIALFHEGENKFLKADTNVSIGEIKWRSNLLDTDLQNSNSRKFYTSSLPPGTHTITAILSATSSGSSQTRTATDTFILTINALPEVFITSPNTGKLVPTGRSVDLVGNATDLEENDLVISEDIQWAYSFDGGANVDLGQGKNASFTPPEAGMYTVYASVKDSNDGESEIKSIQLEAKDPATVTLITPVMNDLFLKHEKIYFNASAQYDGELNNITWRSNVDYDLGSGNEINEDNLSVGTHTITAKVIPLDGEEFSGEASITIEISPDEIDENLGDEEGCGEGQNFAGNPINLQTGNKMQRELDFSTNGRFPLSIQRVYNSQSYSTGLFGPNWASNLDQNITFENNNQTAVIRKMSGSVERFDLVAGQWVSSRPSLVSKNSLVAISNGWIYSLQDGSREEYDSQGKITRVTTVNGYSHNYFYSSDKLTLIQDDALRTLTIAYDGDFIKSITTPDHQVYSYGYDFDLTGAEKHLVSITYPSIEIDGSYMAGVKNYLYELAKFPHALTGITDETDQRFASWGYDSYGRANYSGHGEGSQNGSGFENVNIEFVNNTQTITTNAFGKRTTYNYGSIDGILKTTSIEGHASANCAATGQSTHYYTNGWVKDKTDWNGNVSAFTYNDRGLTTSTKVYWVDNLGAGGNYTGLTPDYTETTLWHETLPKPRVVTKPGLAINYDYYTNGFVKGITKSSTLPLASEPGLQTEFSDRIWHYDYTYYDDSRIATMTIDGPRTDVADTTTYHYDNIGNTTQLVNALGHTRSFGHDRSDTALDWVIDENSVRTDHEFNYRGWPVALTISKGGQQVTERYQYYANGKLKKKTKINEDYETYEYNSARYLTARVNTLGERYETAPALDGSWLTQTIKDASGQIQFQQTRVPDELGRTLRIEGANGQWVKFKYDNNGNVVEQTQRLDSVRESVTHREYDWFNRLTDVYPQGLTSKGSNVHYEYEYNQLKSVTQQATLGNTQRQTAYLFNGFGDVLKEQSSDRGNLFYHYDYNSALVSKKTDARGISETLLYDALGRMTDKKFTSAQENQVFSYDDQQNGNFGVGKLTGIEDASGTTSYQFDYLGNLLDHVYNIESNAYQVSYRYNSYGQLAHMTYPSGRVLDYSYDAQGRLQSLQENKEGSIQSLVNNIQYKSFGPMSHVEYGNGITSDFDYDQSYRLTQNGQWARYHYTIADQLAFAFGEMAHEQGVEYNYDDRGRLQGANWPIDESSLQPIDQGSGQNILSSVTYDYDSFGNLSSRRFGGSLLKSYYVQGQGTLATNTWTQDDIFLKSGSANQLSYMTQMDYRHLSQDSQNPSAQIPTLQTSYGYDASGNLTTRSREVAGNNVSETYDYNHANRLYRVIQDNQQVALNSYNALGQRVKKQGTQASVDSHYGQDGKLIAETDFQGKLIKEWVYLYGQPLALFDNSLRSDKPLWHDSDGNPLTEEQRELLEAEPGVSENYQATMNGDGTLTLILRLNGRSTQSGATEIGFSLTDETSNTNAESFVTFSMAADTRRVPLPIYYDKKIAIPLKQDKRIEFTTVEGDVTQIVNQYGWAKLDRKGDDFTLYGSNDGVNWVELDTTQASVPTQLALEAFALNASLDLSRFTAVEVAEPTFFFHNDINGTPRVMTDINGIATWKSDLAPYGEGFENEFVVGNLNVPGTMQGLDTSLRFPGQYADSETGFNYNYFRDYDSATGRYIQSDPIGLGGGLNTYAYVGGNPVTYFDALGLATQHSFGGGALLALIIPAVGVSGQIGVSIPDDLTAVGCYQLFFGGSLNVLIGGGLYAGAGLSESYATSDGPLPVSDVSTKRYEEAAAGVGVSYGVSRTGSDEWSGTGFIDFLVWVWGDERAQDTPSGISGAIIPKIGAGIGAYLGGGYTTSFTIASRTFEDDCECQ